MSLQTFVSDILFGNNRGISTIIPNVVIEEAHDDQLAITDHTVDRRAEITDNSYIRPSSLRLRYGWSPSAPQFHGLLGAFVPISAGIVNGFDQLFNGADDYLTDVYKQLRELQASRVPFQITTGKRVYQDMLLQQISFSTDAKTEYAMIVTLSCRQVLLVDVVTSVIGPMSSQVSPSQTTGTIDTGTKQVTPPASSDKSILSRIGSLFN